MYKRQRDLNMLVFVMLCILTVVVVILSCSTPAHPTELSLTTTYHTQNYYRDHHTPKRLRYDNHEKYYVDDITFCRSRCFDYHREGRYRHKHDIGRYRHGYERPLTYRERMMRDRVIRNGGSW